MGPLATSLENRNFSLTPYGSIVNDDVETMASEDDYRRNPIIGRWFPTGCAVELLLQFVVI
jgi:hypothetical protein